MIGVTTTSFHLGFGAASATMASIKLQKRADDFFDEGWV